MAVVPLIKSNYPFDQTTQPRYEISYHHSHAVSVLSCFLR